MFDKCREPAAMFMFFGGVAALFFGVIVARGGSPITPEMYGPLAYSIPAYLWVLVQVFVCFGAAISLIMGWRVASFVFSGLFSILMVAFAVMALQAGSTGTVTVANAGFWATPLGLCICFISLRG